MDLLRKMTVMSWSTSLMLSVAFITFGAVAQEAAQSLVEPQPIAVESVATTTPMAEAGTTIMNDASQKGDREIKLLQGLDETFQKNKVLRAPGIAGDKVGSVLFTLWEEMMIEEWRNSDKINTRAPSLGENAGVSTGIRELSLSGIVYKSPTDWTVWMNGQRLKPDALPREIMDIKVHKKYIDLKWYDASSNLIYPIRLRPHQRFNLDSRMFLPGEATSQ
jgi:hypothetical protein